MARNKKDRSDALKLFCSELLKTFPSKKTFGRSDIEKIGSVNPIGLTEFASVADGYGNHTRLSRGVYVIPDSWSGNKAPWALNAAANAVKEPISVPKTSVATTDKKPTATTSKKPTATTSKKPTVTTSKKPTVTTSKAATVATSLRAAVATAGKKPLAAAPAATIETSEAEAGAVSTLPFRHPGAVSSF